MATEVTFYDLPAVEVEIPGWLHIGIPGPKGDPGESGVYVGSGEMPEGYNVQVDPEGECDRFVRTVNGVLPDEQGNVEIPNTGEPGYTPVKGVDYFTPAEVKEIAAQAAGLVEVPEGGGSSDWIPLIDVTLEEAVTSVVADVDVNGNPFLVKEIMFVAKLLKGELATTPYFAIGKPAIATGVFKADGCAWIVTSNLKNDFFCMGTVRLVGTKMRVVSSFLGTGEYNMSGTGPYGSVLSGKEMGGNALSAISVGFTNIALKMPVGSIIKVWGR